MAQSGGKYPRIPKQYFPAVMFACKIIREEGAFNKALSVASNYYGVDKSELEKYIRARQAAGQRGNGGYKLKWYVIDRRVACEANPEWSHSYHIVRGRSRDSVLRTYVDRDMAFDMRNDTGSSYSRYMSTVIVSEHETKAEAEEAFAKLEDC